MRKKDKIHPAFKPQSKISIREKMGASQEHFAMFHHIPKSTLSMVELHQRFWPDKTKNRIEMLQAVQKAESETRDFSEYDKLEKKDLNKLEIKYLTAKRDACNRKKELKKMVFEYQAACTMLKTCHFLRQKFQEEETVEGKVIFYWEIMASLKVAETCPSKQEVMKREIELLEKAMEVWAPFNTEK